MSYRVFITGSGLADEALECLRREGCTFEVGDPRDTAEDLARKLATFRPDALIVRQGKITADVQASSDTLRAICKHGVGTDNIDIDAATRRGIPVMFTPLANFESVAEHTLALMLCLVRRVARETERIRNGSFDKSKYDGLELRGKTLGIVGLGRVGRRVVELVAPFHMTLVAYDPFCSSEAFPADVTPAAGLDDLWPRADIVTLHCPLTPATRGMVNSATISRMKRGVHIVNTARGGLVHELDLAAALRDGRVAGAAIDVFEVEPPDPGSPLLKMDNVVLTTHTAGLSDGSYRNMGIESVRNVLSVLEGQTPDPQCLVNREVQRIQRHQP
jgi:D-3-phosphoglycerate dehydrogenase